MSNNAFEVFKQNIFLREESVLQQWGESFIVKNYFDAVFIFLHFHCINCSYESQKLITSHHAKKSRILCQIKIALQKNLDPKLYLFPQT